MSLLEKTLFGKATGLKSLLDDNDFSGMDSDFQRPATIKNPNYNPDMRSNLPDAFNPAKQETIPFNPSYQRKTSPLVDGTAFQKNVIAQQNQPQTETDDEDGITNYGKADPKGFAKMFGVSLEQMSENWKDKGGFEALMANPAFTVGAALLKSGSQGKSIGAGAIDALVTGGAISKQYADQIKERSAILGPISAEQRDMVRSVLAESDLAETADVSTKIKNFFKGKNTTALNRRALDDVANKALKLVEKETRKKGGQKVRLDRRHIEAAIKELKKEGKIDYSEKGFFNFFGRGIQSTATPLAKGGPVAAGKDYIVGEEGPEMFVSETNGTIINNDDSKVVSMLLESNPQLKNVSKARAVKILKARFPDYF